MSLGIDSNISQFKQGWQTWLNYMRTKHQDRPRFFGIVKAERRRVFSEGRLLVTRAQVYFTGDAVKARSRSILSREYGFTATLEAHLHLSQTGSEGGSPSPALAAPAPQAITFVYIALRSRPGNRPSTSTSTSMSTMDTSTTPRNKRLSNGPGASSADKYPEDSPTRVRYAPRNPAAMQQNHRRYSQPRRPQQQAAPPVEDTQAWPSLGEASKQTKSQRQKSSRAAFGPRPDRSSSTSTGTFETAMTHQLVPQRSDEGALSPEQRDTIESEVEAFRQRLIQQHIPTRADTSEQQQLIEQVIASPEHISSDMRPTPTSVFQHLARHGSITNSQQRPEQQARDLRSDIVSPSPSFVPGSHAGLVTPQQRSQLTAQSQMQALPPQAGGPSSYSAHNFDSLSAFQQAQREATVAQLQSAFFDPAPAVNQPASSAATERRVDYSGFVGPDVPSETPAAPPQSRRPPTAGLNPSAQGFQPRPRSSTSANIVPTAKSGTENTGSFANAAAAQAYIKAVYHPPHDTDSKTKATTSAAAAQAPNQDTAPNPAATTSVTGYINPTYIPVHGNAQPGPGTNTGGSFTGPAPTSTTEPAFTPADYDTSPPLSPSLSALGLEEDQTARDRLTPDNRPLTPRQETGSRYGMEIGGLGVSTLGTSDRTNWLPSPWNPPAQQRDFRVRPRDHEGWGGWEWAMKKGWGSEEDGNKK